MVDRLICVSEGVRATFASAGISEGKLHTILNGIRLRRPYADRLGLRRELGVQPAARIALTVGRLTEQKGYDQLLRAVPRIVTEAPDVVLAWVGVGPLERELRSTVRALELEGRVRFLGRRPDVPSLLASSDVLVLPSRFEGLPLVALEAMVAGVPVVGTRVCGIDEAVVHGETGLLVDEHDVEGLADAALTVLREPHLAARWGAAGRQRVADFFSAARMARETAALYAELLRDVEGAECRADVVVAAIGDGPAGMARPRAGHPATPAAGGIGGRSR